MVLVEVPVVMGREKGNVAVAGGRTVFVAAADRSRAVVVHSNCVIVLAVEGGGKRAALVG